MSLTFSKQPGPRERHLQRKYNNPLFTSGDAITQQDLQNALEQDKKALQQFTEQFRDLVQRAVKLDKNEERDVILKIKAQSEQLYGVCTGLPGDQTPFLEALKKLISAVSKTLHSVKDDEPHAIETLREDDEYTALHLQLCTYAIVSDILNPDQNIGSDELVPTLLSESENGLQAALVLFPPERLEVMIDEGKQLLKNVESKGQNLPQAWQRLTQMESWLKGM
ncbi:hypothetical protein [Sulfurirhabdus autotrophica]|uniref:Uncharacterized protein n=1 Tax=Sulfurirhabdus autotrophica TaxID=1706046 RepID=A0A4R3YEF0_9PROT|nr:hypothetical protein [Sulfurirhabdus autotrophica]TCV90242.1 hypothetical protein EDC63_101212 [Sulfurirhabdus autotrophica]